MNKYIIRMLVLFTVALSGCATNPVTGKSELSLVSETKELAIGKQQYLPARQSQGGDLVTDPVLTAYISEVGNKLAAVSDRKLPYEFRVLNNSIPNAWALPGGKISINRGLLTQLHSEAELAAVLGHEIVHAAAKHAVRQMSQGMLLQTGMLATTIAAQGSKYGNMAQLGAGLGAKLLSTKYGRDAERESDHYGMIYMSRAGYDPQGAVDLQRTFVKLSEGRNQDWIKGLFASHPASQERVQNNLDMLKNLPRGGFVGKARFQAKLAHLNKVKPAYDAYDKGREALAKNQLRKARIYARRAIRIEPKEGMFYGLTGDILFKTKKYRLAKRAYSQSIQRNPNFFYSYLQRGQTEYELKQVKAAKRDLNHSLRLLPTGNAYYTLAGLAQYEGNLNQAKAYYAKVASNKDKMGVAAYTALLKLDLKDNPNKYLQLRIGKTQQGTFAAEVSNPTPKKIAGLQILIQFQPVNGQAQQLTQHLRGTVLAGKKQIFPLRLPVVINQPLKALQAKIISAKVVR